MQNIYALYALDYFAYYVEWRMTVAIFALYYNAIALIVHTVRWKKYLDSRKNAIILFIEILLRC